MRSWRQIQRRPIGRLVATALCAMAMAPRARAMDQSLGTQSTLAPQVAPRNSALDATIASMVRRGVIINLQPSVAKSTPPRTAIARTPNGTTKWRPAGSTSYPAAPVRAPVFTTSPAAPLPPSTSGNTSSEAAEGPVERDPDQSTAQESEAEDRLALAPGAEADDLAPIDELSETPAPDSDAPGDPVEPEMTGEAGADPARSAAKPLRAAPKLGDSGRAPLGEPDRLARREPSPAPPANPEEYLQEDKEVTVEQLPPTKSAPLTPLTRNQRMLRDKVRRVLKHYYGRPLSAADRSPWEVMHAMLAFEVHSRIRQAGPNSQPITAVGWLCFNQPCENRSLLYLNEDGDMRVRVGPALQGHHGQLLALLAQARVRADYPMKVDGKDFTVADLIEVEKATCYPKTELTFKLIGLQRYLDINARWVNDQGMTWDFPTLVREELQQPVRSAACGGTHRLSGLVLAVKKRRASGLPVDGVYAEAERFVANYQNYAYSWQNSDGSFSTQWFKGAGAEKDIDRRLKTTGHTLEWLLYAAGEQQLTYYRTVRAVNYLTNIMWANRTRDWEAGPLGHALHALVLYDRMAFAKYDDQPATGPVAQRPQHRRAKR